MPQLSKLPGNAVLLSLTGWPTRGQTYQTRLAPLTVDASVCELRDPHQRSRVADLGAINRRMEALEGRRVVLIRRDFDERAHELIRPIIMLTAGVRNRSFALLSEDRELLKVSSAGKVSAFVVFS